MENRRWVWLPLVLSLGVGLLVLLWVCLFGLGSSVARMVFPVGFRGVAKVTAQDGAAWTWPPFGEEVYHIPPSGHLLLPRGGPFRVFQKPRPVYSDGTPIRVGDEDDPTLTDIAWWMGPTSGIGTITSASGTITEKASHTWFFIGTRSEFQYWHGNMDLPNGPPVIRERGSGQGV